MPGPYGALTVKCADFSPPLPLNGGKADCVTVPDKLEAEAKLYRNPQLEIIGSLPRYMWVTKALRILTHETEHGRFDIAVADPATAPLKGPSSGTCRPEDVEGELTELAAQMSEFPVVLHRLQVLPHDKQAARLADWFQYHLNNTKEDVTGTLKALRCKCDCVDVDNYIKQVVAFAQAGWNSYEKSTYHKEMKQPAYNLSWPVDPPPAIDVHDLPSSPPAVDPKDKADVAALKL
jgi:hypothetical protein